MAQPAVLVTKTRQHMAQMIAAYNALRGDWIEYQALGGAQHVAQYLVGADGAQVTDISLEEFVTSMSLIDTFGTTMEQTVLATFVKLLNS